MKHILLLLLVIVSYATQAQSNLTDSTFIYIKADRFISSRDARYDSNYSFTVVEDVYANGIVIIEEGAKVQGKVIYSKRASFVGEPGMIEIQLDTVEGINQTYEVDGPILYSEGKSRKILSCCLSIVVTPLFLLIRGQEAMIVPTTEIEIYLAPTRSQGQSN